MTLMADQTQNAFPSAFGPASLHRDLEEAIQFATREAAAARATAESARRAYREAALRTRALRDRETVLQADLRVAQQRLRTVRAGIVLDGLADAKAEADAEREVDRLASTLDALREERIPAALAADIRADWVAVAAEDALDLVERRLSALVSFREHAGGRPPDLFYEHAFWKEVHEIAERARAAGANR